MQQLRRLPSPSQDDSRPKTVPFTVLVPQSPSKSILVRFWRYWRGLIRRRQDSHEVRRLRRVLLSQDEKVVADLGAMRTALEAVREENRVLKELTIPKLERELEVEKAYSTFLAAGLVRERKQVEADIAASCLRIASGHTSETAIRER